MVKYKKICLILALKRLFTNDKQGEKMMKLGKRIVMSILTVSILILSGNYSNAAVQIPENVRIGLYFNDHTLNKAVSSFTVSAAKGIQLGSFKDNSFLVLYETPSIDCITIRKDTFFVKNNNVLKEYDPTQKTLPQGEKIGPYHVKIGGEYKDINEVNTKISEYRQKGIESYPVYIDTWQVWTGFYIDQATALNTLNNSIKQKLVNVTLSVVEPAANRIVALSGESKVIMMFGSATGSFQVHPRKENNPYVLKLDEVPYRGNIEVKRFEQSDMTVINVLPLEHYLYGVVPGEIEASSHIEALKAQAVAARTYTLNNLRKHEKIGFDLCNTTYCQVYKGYSKENISTNKAVDQTKGKLVIYSGKPAQVFYFSSSGGKTEDAKNVWGSDIPYLKSVEDKYESGNSWKYTWETNYSAEEIKNLMGGRLGDIINVAVTKTSNTGRATEIVVRGTSGERVYTNGNSRGALKLDSQWYYVSTDADAVAIGKNGQKYTICTGNRTVVTANGTKIVKTFNGNLKNKISIVGAGSKKKVVYAIPSEYKFSGRGWGHAVGMSQEGAKGMAKVGFTYDKILEHYFQGTKVQ